MSRLTNIIIVETASVIIEGLSGILQRSGLHFHIFRAGNLCDLEKIIVSHKKSIVIINPSLVQPNSKLFHALKSDFPDVQWIAVMYAVYDPQHVAVFDSAIGIYDTPEMIIDLIKKSMNTRSNHETTADEEVLSEREIEVLKLLATGHASKEIADKLHISINTVITHRKNISQKTGIKSVSGLTIYAVVKKLITLNNPS